MKPRRMGGNGHDVGYASFVLRRKQERRITRPLQKKQNYCACSKPVPIGRRGNKNAVKVCATWRSPAAGGIPILRTGAGWSKEAADGPGPRSGSTRARRAESMEMGTYVVRPLPRPSLALALILVDLDPGVGHWAPYLARHDTRARSSRTRYGATPCDWTKTGQRLENVCVRERERGRDIESVA
jgi:hypothetical protein